MTDATAHDDTNPDERNTDELTALKHLAAGRSIAFAAAASQLSDDEVHTLASRHPDQASRTEAIEALLRRFDRAQLDELSGPARK